jgi:hypothetical protein
MRLFFSHKYGSFKPHEFHVTVYELILSLPEKHLDSIELEATVTKYSILIYGHILPVVVAGMLCLKGELWGHRASGRLPVTHLKGVNIGVQGCV